MSYVGLFVVVSLGALVAFYLRARARNFVQREWELLPVREAYRERLCLFVMQGYRDASRDSDEPSMEIVAGYAGRRSRDAGYIPKEAFEETVQGMMMTEGELIAHFASLVDPWAELYTREQARDAENLALRRAAQTWSETFFKPGVFRPESIWSAYPTVKPGARHFDTREKVARRATMSRGQLDVPELPPDPLPGKDVVSVVTKAVHESATLQIQMSMPFDPDVSDEALGAKLLAWFDRSLEGRNGAFADSARAFFSLSQLTDIVADKAYAVRSSVVRAVGNCVAEDADASDRWIADRAIEILGETLPLVRRLLSPDFVADMCAIHAYRCRRNPKPPREWGQEQLDRLNAARVVRTAAS